MTENTLPAPLPITIAAEDYLLGIDEVMAATDLLLRNALGADADFDGNALLTQAFRMALGIAEDADIPEGAVSNIRQMFPFILDLLRQRFGAPSVDNQLAGIIYVLRATAATA